MEGIIHVWQEDNDTWSSLENTYSPVTYLKLTPRQYNFIMRA